jgi:hypothetical protein
MKTGPQAGEISAAKKRRRLKYIIIKHAGKEVPLVFSAVLSHRHLAQITEITSAGFCEWDAAGKWTCTGQSDSLGLIARPQDADILNFHLFL